MIRKTRFTCCKLNAYRETWYLFDANMKTRLQLLGLVPLIGLTTGDYYIVATDDRHCVEAGKIHKWGMKFEFKRAVTKEFGP